MYERFFGFRERPFDLTSNPRCLVPTAAHREAIGTIEYGLATRKGTTVLIGEPGTGKTTVIRAVIDRQPATVRCVHLCNPALTRAEFIDVLGTGFGLSEKARQSKSALLRELEALLHHRHAAGETTALIVDEAQGLSLNLLEEIRLLANIETDEQKLLLVILAGQPQLAARLEDPSMSQLKQRIALWCELRPLTFDETAAYILNRIESAGGVAAEVFTIQAVRLIHEAARGLPRLINVLADNALVTAFGAARRPVNSEIIHHVCRDVRIRQEPGRAPQGPATVPGMSTQAKEPSSGDGRVTGRASGSLLPFLDRPAAKTQREPSIAPGLTRRYLS